MLIGWHGLGLARRSRSDLQIEMHGGFRKHYNSGDFELLIVLGTMLSSQHAATVPQ